MKQRRTQIALLVSLLGFGLTAGRGAIARESRCPPAELAAAAMTMNQRELATHCALVALDDVRHTRHSAVGAGEVFPLTDDLAAEGSGGTAGVANFSAAVPSASRDRPRFTAIGQPPRTVAGQRDSAVALDVEGFERLIASLSRAPAAADTRVVRARAVSDDPVPRNAQRRLLAVPVDVHGPVARSKDDVDPAVLSIGAAAAPPTAGTGGRSQSQAARPLPQPLPEAVVVSIPGTVPPTAGRSMSRVSDGRPGSVDSPPKGRHRPDIEVFDRLVASLQQVPTSSMAHTAAAALPTHDSTRAADRGRPSAALWGYKVGTAEPAELEPASRRGSGGASRDGGVDDIAKPSRLARAADGIAGALPVLSRQVGTTARTDSGVTPYSEVDRAAPAVAQTAPDASRPSATVSFAVPPAASPLAPEPASTEDRHARRAAVRQLARAAAAPVVPAWNDRRQVVVGTHAEKVLHQLAALRADAGMVLQGLGDPEVETVVVTSHAEKVLLTLQDLRATSGGSRSCVPAEPSPAQVAPQTASVLPADAGAADAPTHARDPAPFGDSVAIAQGELDQVRGGFVTSQGLAVSFGIERAVYVNGALMTTTSLNLSDLGQVTRGRGISGQPDPVTLGLIQMGSGNSFAPGTLGSTAIGTVIQNSLDNEKIQSVTVINAAVNSAQVLRDLNLQQSLRAGITASLGR